MWVKLFFLMLLLPWLIWIYCFTKFVASLFRSDLLAKLIVILFDLRRSTFLSKIFYFVPRLWLWPRALFILKSYPWLFWCKYLCSLYEFLSNLLVLVRRGVLFDFCWVLVCRGIYISFTTLVESYLKYSQTYFCLMTYSPMFFLAVRCGLLYFVFCLSRQRYRILFWPLLSINCQICMPMSVW